MILGSVDIIMHNEILDKPLDFWCYFVVPSRVAKIIAILGDNSVHFKS